MVEGSYCLWEWGGRAVSSIPTSTLHPRLPTLLPHSLFPGLFVSLTRSHCCSLHAQEVLPHAGKVQPPHPRTILAVCSSARICGAVFPHAGVESDFPHAQAIVLPVLTQLGKELPFSGHSRFPQRGIGYVFSCVLWVGVSSLVHGLCFGAVDLPTFLLAVMTNCIWATRFTE